MFPVPMRFSRVGVRSWIAVVLPALALGYGCQGQFGPDFFNFTAQVQVWSQSLPGVARLASVASVLTRLQEKWLHMICSEGFSIQDCAQRQDPSVCKFETWLFHGWGYVFFDYDLALRGTSTGTVGCCQPAAWSAIRDDTIELQELLGHNELFKGFPYSWTWSVLQDGLYDVWQAGSTVALENADTGYRDIYRKCMGCAHLYAAFQSVAGFAGMIAWQEVYSEAYRANVIPWGVEVKFEGRGVNHHSIVYALLRDLEEMQEEGAFQDLRVAEVGVYQGAGSYRWLQQVPSLSMLLVDPYQEVFGSGDRFRELYRSDPAEDLALLRRRMAGFVREGRASIMVSSSVTAATWVPDASLAMVFIDGDHSEAAVAQDIRAWAPKVCPGGIVAGHDYEPFMEWGAASPGDEGLVSPRLVSTAEWDGQARGVAAAVHAALPPGHKLHLAPSGVWWWWTRAGEA